MLETYGELALGPYGGVEVGRAVSLQAAKIIEAVRARGNDPRDLRDAAHEAHHALEVKAKDWDRDAGDAPRIQDVSEGAGWGGDDF